MRVAVFGLGYVGLVTALCYAHNGHEVVGVEKDLQKLDRLRRGVSTIGEPGVQDLLDAALASGRLSVLADEGVAVKSTDISLVCVGTPSSAARGTDLTAVSSVMREIGGVLCGTDRQYSVVLRSTVPPGTMREHMAPALEGASGRQVGYDLDLYYHPEFLRQGTAIEDFRQPPFVVWGTHDGSTPRSIGLVDVLCKNVGLEPIILNFQEAELLKMACNAFHALKIDFANEIGSIAGCVGADASKVMAAFTADTKLNISAAYLRPGFAFGGSCLAKDVRSLNHVARAHELCVPVAASIIDSNDAHLDRIARELIDHEKGVIGMVGITFKPNTDDLRESAAMRLLERLRKAGRDVLVFEPAIQTNRLIGANRDYLSSALPDYRDRLVEWNTLREGVDVILITRDGVIGAEELARFAGKVIELDALGIRRRDGAATVTDC